MPLEATASQTVGPFFHLGLARLYCDDLVVPGVPGKRISLRGQVLDGDDKGVRDALIEIWQADSSGKYPAAIAGEDTEKGPFFRGFGRVPTDENGAFKLSTIKPGRVPGPGGVLQAPHLVVSVFMRGLLRQLVTRMYFPDEPSNAQDFVLKLAPPERRDTLIARPVAGDNSLLEWQIALQGERETVFFDW